MCIWNNKCVCSFKSVFIASQVKESNKSWVIKRHSCGRSSQNDSIKSKSKSELCKTKCFVLQSLCNVKTKASEAYRQWSVFSGLWMNPTIKLNVSFLSNMLFTANSSGCKCAVYGQPVDLKYYYSRPAFHVAFCRAADIVTPHNHTSEIEWWYYELPTQLHLLNIHWT